MTTAKARREETYHLAVTTGLASVEELSRHVNVTASTIRRDIAHLNGEGKLARTYGGAAALGAHPEPSLRQRTARRSSRSRPLLPGWPHPALTPSRNSLIHRASRWTASAAGSAA